MALQSVVSGFGLSAGLIIAIGAQNAYVLKQGLLQRNVFVIVALCSIFDAFLIGLGVGGMGYVVHAHPGLMAVVRYAGAIFLVAYGVKAFRAAWRGGGHLEAVEQPSRSTWQTALQVLALSALNPHVYLDTVVLLGSIGGRLPWPDRAWFAGGAMSASIAWFSLLGFGARFLRPVFRKESAWRMLDIAIGIIMLSMAASLLFA
ncbi:LysE/ArgO family amino acid transporter [Robbsia sp. Bb-Pol-6]|uniref:LysE/ArgO family amino acid transporter n=1 Tax=Robbsia betulipollinis TaxID=2981849 RepID=A0ABT3ZHQ7_9BURK|nr:LysE/ArgO family amino acid transporter [Robbsia betulipollinis]MCY0386059.1 LysE/ArgO family amino acid transporter [Robbsia betulipollinis]